MNDKKVTIIWIVVLALIIMAGGGVGYWLWFDVLDKKKAELKQVKMAVADAQAKKDKILTLLKQIEDLEKQEKEKIQRIPNLDVSKEYDGFANLLDDLRRRAGVSVPKATWQTPAKPAGVPGRPAKSQPATVHKVQYDLAVSGTFYQLLRYVNLLEQEKRFIGVDNFSISKSGSEAVSGAKAQAPKRELKVTIYSYTYKQPDKPLEIALPDLKSGKTTDIPD